METTRRVYYAPLTSGSEIRLLFAGCMQGGSSHGSRPYCLLHYVTDGSGSVTAGNHHYDLSAGDLFANPPGASVDYRPLKHDPWTCYWLAFEGAGVQNYLAALVPCEDNPICYGDYDPEVKQLFEQLLQSISRKSVAESLLSEATMRLILSKFLIQYGKDTTVGKTGTPLKAVRRAQDFMLRHHSEPIAVSDVCRAVGYERTYFSNLFRKQTGQTMREYLASIRITKACKLLTTTDLSVQDIALRLGYGDYRAFSRCFKKEKQLSPQQYRLADGAARRS